MSAVDTLDLWRPAVDETSGDVPIYTGGYVTDDFHDCPTNNETFVFTVVYGDMSDAARVRNGVRRALVEFGPAFERLGSE